MSYLQDYLVPTILIIIVISVELVVPIVLRKAFKGRKGKRYEHDTEEEGGE